MKLNKKITLGFIGVLTLMVIVIYSCTKGDVIPVGPTLSADATIMDTGSIAADGCGWLIKTDADSVFFAGNLDAKYQINKQQLHITYRKLTTRYYCGSVPVPLNKGLTQIELYTVTAK